MKVSELEGELLDLWVAKADNLEGIEFGWDGKFHGSVCAVDEGGNEDWYIYSPSTDWSQGGPIIDALNIELTYHRKRKHIARIGLDEGVEGGTKLIAAMRCFVASKFGDEVDDS